MLVLVLGAGVVMVLGGLPVSGGALVSAGMLLGGLPVSGGTLVSAGMLLVLAGVVLVLGGVALVLEGVVLVLGGVVLVLGGVVLVFAGGVLVPVLVGAPPVLVVVGAVLVLGDVVPLSDWLVALATGGCETSTATTSNTTDSRPPAAQTHAVPCRRLPPGLSLQKGLAEFAIDAPCCGAEPRIAWRIPNGATRSLMDYERRQPKNPRTAIITAETEHASCNGAIAQVLPAEAAGVKAG